MTQYPLDDEEIREMTLWETDAEIPAFRAGWMYRRSQTMKESRRFVYAGALGLYPDNQNERVAWERGWGACESVYRVMFKETE